MERFARYVMLGCLAAACAGCAVLSGSSPAAGRRSFRALQQAAESAGKSVTPSLALVKLEKERSVDGGGMMMQMGGAGSPSFTGLVLTPEGHILVPEIVKPGTDDRIAVWIGDADYEARPIKVDESLGMTILKIDSDDRFTPLDFRHQADLCVGEWALVVTPSDEAADYQKFISLAMCRGEVAGRYRRYQMQGLLRDTRGAPVLSLAGRIVGLSSGGDVIAITDLHADLVTFIEEATRVRSPNEEARRKGWLGAVLHPINKEYAELRNLPASALWVAYVDADGPAATAGLKKGDLIVALNGQPLRLTGERVREYFQRSLRPRVGDPFSLGLMRDGKVVGISGTIGKRPEPETRRAEDLGFTVSSISDIDIFQQNLFAREGVMVTDVRRGSPAATASNFRKTLIAVNDVIVELGGRPTPTIKAFGEALEAIRHEKPAAVLVKYWRGRETGYEALNLKIGEKDNGDKE